MFVRPIDNPNRVDECPVELLNKYVSQVYAGWKLNLRITSYIKNRIKLNLFYSSIVQFFNRTKLAKFKETYF